MTKLILIRGLPGSGKSYQADLLSKLWGFIHLEADMFHVDGEGKYDFRRENVKAAHAWCQTTTLAFLRNGKDVVVSNAFTQKWEMEPYLLMAEFANCSIEIRVANGNYGNIHEVPANVIEAMKSRWDDTVAVIEKKTSI